MLIYIIVDEEVISLIDWKDTRLYSLGYTTTCRMLLFLKSNFFQLPRSYTN